MGRRWWEWRNGGGKGFFARGQLEKGGGKGGWDGEWEREQEKRGGWDWLGLVKAHTTPFSNIGLVLI